MGRSSNKSFFHYVIQEVDVETQEFGDKEYFFTAGQIREKYNISRSTLHRILTQEGKSKFPHFIEKCNIHHTILSHI